MLGTDFRTGSPNWIDLGSPDTTRAAAFYGAVFGWQFASAGPEAGGYGFFQLGGKTVGALGPLSEDGAKSAWTTYFQSDDIQSTARDVVAAGGAVRAEPMDVMGEGWLAQFTDPQGAQFAVWQPGKTKGLEKTSEDNTLVWTELHVPDPVRAIDFYNGLFGWRSEEMQAPGMVYRVLSIKDGEQREASFGGVAALQEGQRDPSWVPYFAVADADVIVTKVQENDGSVLMPAADVPDVGRIAWLADPYGAVFAVLKPNPRQG
ncbi:VOC family protein [Streptomyces sp. CBMA152]|uniref:VOC family protein n=1 Tax=Streptomyces sp. CBMA152 TaxID=1896312 RepID=UPI001660AB69|nr:VOC family protein [Streptomyces sp. CBMA152]MBD0741079.1 hydroxylase [Streptomyces sp. CBMA152]